MDGSVLEERSSPMMLELSFSSTLNRSSDIVSFVKTTSKKTGAFYGFFFLRRLLFIFINLPYGLALNTVAICWINYRNLSVGLLVLNLQSSLILWFILEI